MTCKRVAFIIAIFIAITNSAFAETDKTACASWLNHKVTQLHSPNTIDLCEVSAGKPLLIVNTASHCGYTGQFRTLEQLHQKYKDQDLVVIGFPSNDFNQEADDSAETAAVCYENYGVSFLMTEKQVVKGENPHPVFQHLGQEQGQPNWNFNKYIVNRQGEVVKKLGSKAEPMSKLMQQEIESVL